MKLITDFEQNSPEWLEYRRGRINGTTKVTEFTGKKMLKDFWAMLAEQVVAPEDQVETARDRGHRLEEEAVMRAAEQLGVKLYRPKVAVCVSDEDDRIQYSPDDLAEPVDGKFLMDFEAKCFEGPAHLESVINDYIPDKTQMLRPFTINKDLQVRNYVFYHDRIMIPKLSLKIIQIKREDYELDIETLAERDKAALKRIDDIILEYF